MIIQRIQGFTRLLGRSQGYIGLPVRDTEIMDAATGRMSPAMETAWQPTPDELAALNRGANIHVRLLGSGHPPIMLEVGPTPDEG